MAEAKLKARAEMDTTRFDGGLDKMTKGVKTFSSDYLKGLGSAIAGAFAVSKIYEWGRAQLAAADTLVTLSETLGLTTDVMQAFYSVGKNVNISISEIDIALSRLSVSQDKVVDGNKEMIDAFSRLGISAEEVSSKNTEQLLEAIASGAKNSATALNDMAEIFGRGMGVKMMPLMKQIAKEGIQGLINKSKELGESIDAINLQRMANAADEIEHSFKKVGIAITNALMKLWDFSESYGAYSELRSKGFSMSDSLRLVSAGIVNFAEKKKMEEQSSAISIAQAQKIAQQKTNIAKSVDEKYQKELTKMLEDSEKERAANEKRINKETEDRKLKRLQSAQLKMWREEDMREAVFKVMEEKTPSISVGAPEAADQYARMGLYSGGQINNAPRMVMERHLKVAEEMNRRDARRLEIEQEFLKTERRIEEKLGG